MNWLFSAAAFLAAWGVVAFALWLWKRMAKTYHLPLRRVLFIIAGGVAAAILGGAVQNWALAFAEVSLVAEESGSLNAALATIAFAAPLKEALKVAVVWPLYLRRRLISGQVGAIYAVLAASGFAALEVGVLSFSTEAKWLLLLRALFAVPAHLFFAGLWGYMLGGSGRDRFFALVWVAGTFLHGVYDHIVVGRGPALLVIVVPMLALMAFGVFALLREHAPASGGRMTAYSLFEPPSVGSVREALSRKGRPVMIHWVLIGAFVNLGVTLTFLGVSVYLGHRWGIDFSLAEEAGMEGILPVLLLAIALLTAFPVSAYLIARASGAVSVLEPAWATGASIIVVLALFSVTEPTALVIAMAIAPVGFTLACAGAWFGLERVQ
jgi:hypothetical protein